MKATLDVKLLGAVCSGNCSLLERNLLAALNELSLNYKLTRVDDLTTILKYGCKIAPGLVINDNLVLEGNVLSVGQLKELLATLIN